MECTECNDVGHVSEAMSQHGSDVELQIAALEVGKIDDFVALLLGKIRSSPQNDGASLWIDRFLWNSSGES